jgi:glycosyltransferase involved in cell wall biosynthesis
LLSVIIPAYNTETYLANALDSVLAGRTINDGIEVVVVDDGSTDGTAALAQRYVEAYPGMIRLVSQPNDGHGGAINTGLGEVTGRYLKILDSDDWFDSSALTTMLATLRRFAERGETVDLVVNNYVYEKKGKRHKTVVRYRHALPRRQIVTWDQTHRFGKKQYMLMHALTYRTDVVRASGLRLPEHTFYVDNLYALIPLHKVQTLYYLDVDLYRYLIGRDGQSVQEDVMLGRIDQQLRVNWMMIEHLSHVSVSEPRLQSYRLHYLQIMCTISSMLLLRSGTPEALQQKRMLWRRMRLLDPELYHDLRWSLLGQACNLPGRSGRYTSVLTYQLAQRFIGFS